MVVPYAPGEDARFCCRADSKVKPKNVGIDKLSEPLPFREYHVWEVDVLSFLRNYGSRCSPWTEQEHEWTVHKRRYKTTRMVQKSADRSASVR
jgi:hypothetical protein